jgi:hypothetical protein
MVVPEVDGWLHCRYIPVRVTMVADLKTFVTDRYKFKSRQGRWFVFCAEPIKLVGGRSPASSEAEKSASLKI